MDFSIGIHIKELLKSFLPKLSSRLNIIPAKNASTFLWCKNLSNYKLILHFILKCKGPRILKKMLKKKKTGRLTVVKMYNKIYYKLQ